MLYASEDAKNLKIVARPEGGSIQFNTNGWFDESSERMRITSEGYVGIGTTEPEEWLSVESSKNSISTIENTRLAYFDRTFDNSSARFEIYVYPNTSNISEYMRSSVMLYSGLDARNLKIASPHSEGTIQFITNGWINESSERMRITSVGNVGIGITTPGERLDVNGNIHVEGKLIVDGEIDRPGHVIGESFGGGIVFYVTPGGKHGLIAAKQDQSSTSDWYGAQDDITNPVNHDALGKEYTDWRLPTKRELSLLYTEKDAVGGFGTGNYWCSTELDYTTAWFHNLDTDSRSTIGKNNLFSVRSIRSF